MACDAVVPQDSLPVVSDALAEHHACGAAASQRRDTSIDHVTE
jgi:hypothetical protein